MHFSKKLDENGGRQNGIAALDYFMHSNEHKVGVSRSKKCQRVSHLLLTNINNCVPSIQYTICVQFRITLKSMRSQCHEKSFTVQFKSRPVTRVQQFKAKVCNVLLNISLLLKYLKKYEKYLINVHCKTFSVRNLWHRRKCQTRLMLLSGNLHSVTARLWNR